VAEMHGELVEFNDRLHRVINQKEAMIKRLREELIELRGPLPEGVQVGEFDEISTVSDFSIPTITSSLSRPLVNIWIPTAFLAGQQKTSSHHVYQVYLRIKDEEWNVYRRYSQFHDLHSKLRSVILFSSPRIISHTVTLTGKSIPLSAHSTFRPKRPFPVVMHVWFRRDGNDWNRICAPS
jgi:hypothetical protein